MTRKQPHFLSKGNGIRSPTSKERPAESKKMEKKPDIPDFQNIKVTKLVFPGEQKTAMMKRNLPSPPLIPRISASVPDVGPDVTKLDFFIFGMGLLCRTTGKGRMETHES